MRRFTLLFCLAFVWASSYAQPFDFEGEASGSVGTFTNGWVGSPTTDFRWQADDGGTGSPGTGPAVDHTLGTAAGIYIYTEASAPAAPGDVATLTSPVLSLAGLTFPGLSFWYHKFGAGMGDLYIEIDDNGTWVVLDSIIGSTQTSETDAWLNRQVNLAGYGSSVQVRFRAVRGGNFDGDMAIDDVDLVDLPAFEAILTDAFATTNYTQFPSTQVPNDIFFGGSMVNGGGDTLTDVTLFVEAGAFFDSVVIGDVLPGAGATAQLTTPYVPGTGTTVPVFGVFSAEADADSFNNIGFGLPLTVSDSIYARDDSSFTGSLGIGAGTTGVLGQNFELTQADTLTSVSFFLTNPPVGQQLWIDVYSFNGTPQNIIASSDTLVIPTDTGAWYTLRFCPTRLEPGTYFFGANEGDQNITLATTTGNFEPNSGWVIFGTNPWEPSEFYGFTVSYLLRANFGSSISLDLGMDTTICALDSISLTVPSNFSNPLWFGGAAQDTLTVAGPIFVFTQATGLDGCPYSDSINIDVFPIESAGRDSTSGVCENEAAVDLMTLLGGSPAMGGTWTDDDGSGALMGSMFDPAIAGPGQFSFTYAISDTCGYDSMATATVGVLDGPKPGEDTTVVLCLDAGAVDLETLLTGSALPGGTFGDDDNTGALAGSDFNATTAGEGTFTVSYTSTSIACGEATSFMSITVETCVGISGFEANWFNLYPNPNEGSFNLTFTAGTNSSKMVRLIDQMGRQVYQELVPAATDTYMIQANSLPKGVYLLQVEAGDRVGQRHVVIR